jgi:AcrR family transcriptional regulator
LKFVTSTWQTLVVTRGRTRDEDAKQRILDATIELIGTQGQGKVRIDDIAELATVGKQTIYRWWPTRNALVLDALLDRTLKETPFKNTADARKDFRDHLRDVAKLFASPTGRLICDMLADAQTSPEVAEEFRTRFWQPRRNLSLARLQQSINEGEVRADVPVEAALDALYSPLWVRLLIGHQPITVKLVDDILDCVWPGICVNQ